MNYSKSPEEINNRAEIAPKTPSLIDYKLKFGVNKNLKIAEEAKVVEAYIHNDNKRLTLLYHGLGSYTFSLR